MKVERSYSRRHDGLIGLEGRTAIPVGRPKDGYDEGQAGQIVAYTEGIRRADQEIRRG
jgi:hypothetical protein